MNLDPSFGIPVVYLVGDEDILRDALAWPVAAVKRGVFDFVGQPVSNNTLADREVMRLVLEGRLNKLSADGLGTGVRTGEGHRCRVSDKMAVRSAVEIARRPAGLEQH